MATPERSSSTRIANDIDDGHAPSVSTLIGEVVRNPQGEAIGILKGIVGNDRADRVTCVVLEGGGVLGTNGQLFAVPPAALTFNDDNRGLLLDIDRGVPKDVEGVQSYDVAEVSELEGERKLHSYAGLVALIRAQHLGANLVDSRSEEL